MRHASHRVRSFVLLTVLVIVGAALLIATSLLFSLQADAAGATSSLHSARSRALARSGLHLIMRRLDDQRGEVTAGRLPQLDEQYDIFVDGGRRGVVRLLPVTPAGDVLAAEAGKLDLNHVDADTLVATGQVDQALAEAIIDTRDRELGGSFQSVAELLLVPGMDARTMYGELEDMAWLDQASRADSGLGERVEARLASVVSRGLADVVTVYCVEPTLQQRGVKQIGLDLELTGEVRQRIEDRFGDLAQPVVALLADLTVREESDIVRVLRGFGIPEERWHEVLDVFTTESGDYHFGRLDINTASYEALATLFAAEQAANIVRARDARTEDDRANLTWPLLDGLIDAETMQRVSGRITTRSFTYRVRLAAGTVDDEAPDGPLADPVIYEAVFDLCDPQTRLAYLREVTLMQTAAMLTDASSSAFLVDDLALESNDDADDFEDTDDTSDSALDDFDPDSEFADESEHDPPDGSDLAGPPDGASQPEDPSTPSGSPDARPPAASRVGRWTAGRGPASGS